MHIPGYEVQREIGQGGMALVYLALQESLNRDVALKIIKSGLTENEEFAQRFIREGRIIARLNHPHIITVYDIGAYEGAYYLSMEYLPGGTLQQRIQSGLSIQDALLIARALASALSYAHQGGIIHRDIKPQNILFHNNGYPVLTDFGIAKILGSTTMVTRAGLSLGTPRYMSPEQVRGLEVDARADIYSFGILLYQMLTGRVPYTAEDSFVLGMMHVTAPLPDLPIELNRFQPLMNQMLAKDPDRRLQSAQEFVTELDLLETESLSLPKAKDFSEVSDTYVNKVGRGSLPSKTSVVSQEKDVLAIVKGTPPKYSGNWVRFLVLLVALVGLILFAAGGYIWSQGKVALLDSAAPKKTSVAAANPNTGVAASKEVASVAVSGDYVSSGSGQSAKPPLSAIETLLRFHGSNTIGGKLLPELVNTFLKEEGYTNIRSVPGLREEEEFVVGEINGVEKKIEIQAHGSKTAFEGLQNGLCDIGMASRKIKPDEQKKISPFLGDLTSNASEHVLALDGIAVIVHPSNPVKVLTIGQLADIFSGVIYDWSQVGGQKGPISVYARDEKSGTWDFFNDAVLKKYNKSLNAKDRFEDSLKLSDSVYNDIGGIGFIGLNYIGLNKVIGLSDAGIDARKPSLLTVKTEDYILSRRLFLYTAVQPNNSLVSRFIEFALSDKAQAVIQSIGLVSMDLTPVSKSTEDRQDDPRNKSARWRNLTVNADSEIPTRFRFRAGSSELDSRASRDIGRIVRTLGQKDYQGRSLILIGFADASGPHNLNCKLSQERADIVKRELTWQGFSFHAVKGLCEEAPIVPNDTPENQEKNRRVEVWVK